MPTQHKPCVFCQIVSGAAPAYFVYRDACCAAFLDVRPLFAGHMLLVPVAHVPTLVELSPALIAPIFSVAQLLARAAERVGAAGSFVAMNNRISQSVPHLHIHVVPRRPRDGLKGFFWPRIKYPDHTAALSVQRELQQAILALMQGL